MKANRAKGAGVKSGTTETTKTRAPKRDNRKVNSQEEAPGRPRIMPMLWLKGMQGLISQALGFRTSRSKYGVQQVGYYQGIHTEKQHNELRRRRAKNKVARKSRRINRLRAKH